MTEATATVDCSSSRDENGVYIITLHTPTRGAIEQYFRHVEAATQHALEHNEKLILYVMDASPLGSKSPSLVYFFQKARQFRKHFPNRPVTRTAVIYDKGIILSLVNSFMRSIGNDDDHDGMRFFNPSEREDAMAWLMGTQ